ncbi:MAG: peptidase dimerization domain-containing protein [Kiritimatiellales bacterium]|nr:peptidase dimerization domain-containing protein [Kiritimatiellota bacterium]MBL7011310.1 peptidase dimerization domain-containing protein [Kiritimatiellales bacterium]
MSKEYKSVEEIISDLPAIREVCVSLRETLLANLVMLGEIPAPTFKEEARVNFLMQRFSECGLTNTSSDECGNGLGIVPGKDRTRNILVMAHADTVFSERRDHTVSVHAERISGPGIADNSLGLAVLATLPTMLEKLGIELNSGLVLMGAARSLGRGDLEGPRFFLENNKLPLTSGICVEGVKLGRLSYASAGMLRGEISCRVPEEYDWIRRGATGAILVMNEVINRILGIALPRKPQTSIVLGSVEAGTGFNIIPTEATLRFEVRSESSEIVERISGELEDIIEDVTSQTGSEVTLDVVARREVAGLGIGHPLVKQTREIMSALDLRPHITPSISELSALIASDVPAVTLGITEGEHLHEQRETVKIDPIFTGLTQLIAVLLAIDGGFCDESE